MIEIASDAEFIDVFGAAPQMEADDALWLRFAHDDESLEVRIDPSLGAFSYVLRIGDRVIARSYREGVVAVRPAWSRAERTGLIRVTFKDSASAGTVVVSVEPTFAVSEDILLDDPLKSQHHDSVLPTGLGGAIAAIDREYDADTGFIGLARYRTFDPAALERFLQTLRAIDLTGESSVDKRLVSLLWWAPWVLHRQVDSDLQPELHDQLAAADAAIQSELERIFGPPSAADPSKETL